MKAKMAAHRPLRPYARWIPLAFLAPHLLVFCCFNIFPILTGIFASLTKWTLGEMPQWVGLANYANLLTNPESIYYWQLRWGLLNTVKFVVFCVPFRILVPLAFALVLSSKCRGHKVLQACYYLPSLLSLSVVMVSWLYMFDSNAGIVNTLLGLGKFRWTTTEPYNWIALIFITVWWGCGGNLIIYQSAIAGVSQEILEAASVDGANAFQRCIHITLPSIKFPLQYTIITSVIRRVWHLGSARHVQRRRSHAGGRQRRQSPVQQDAHAVHRGERLWQFGRQRGRRLVDGADPRPDYLRGIHAAVPRHAPRQRLRGGGT